MNLIINLKKGQYLVPDFQREFEWRPSDIRQLMRSIFSDYYIGNFLFWKGKRQNYEALSCESIFGYVGEPNPNFIVLDGQQRLTAIFYAFTAPDMPLPQRSNRYYFYIRIDRFIAEEYDEAFTYEWNKSANQVLQSSREEQYKRHIFPLSVVGESLFSVPNWLQGYEKYWAESAEECARHGDEVPAQIAREHATNAKQFADCISELVLQYKVSYIALDEDIEVAKVCDIFTQINSRGIQLDIFDLLNALLRPKSIQLKKMWRDAKPKFDFLGSDKTNVYILQVMSILTQGYCSPKYLYYLMPGQEKTVRDPSGSRRKEILINDANDFEKRWHTAVDALDKSIALLRHPQEFGVTSANYLPYESILPIFSALQSYVKTMPSQTQLEAQRKVRHWYWASVFTNRYSGSVESTAARDFFDVRAWIDSNETEPALLREFALTFRNLVLRNETKRGSSIYNGIFNLLILQGARDWVTGNVPHPDELDDHHIVPASWGQKYVPNNLINSILNRTPLTSTTNRDIIRDRLPNEYLRELIAANGEEQVSSMLAAHSISSKALEILLRDPFTPIDYEEFINERQRTIVEAIENLLVKRRLDLPPALRDLDKKLADLEIRLRTTIAVTLNGDKTLLPDHVANNVSQRIQKALNKDAAMDSERYDTLEGTLDFFDFRELQGTITSKQLWDRFAGRFRNKEQLDKHFDQIAELRNTIRHIRPLADYTRKEGEAAILWFEQVLSKGAVVPCVEPKPTLE